MIERMTDLERLLEVRVDQVDWVRSKTRIVRALANYYEPVHYPGNPPGHRWQLEAFPILTLRDLVKRLQVDLVRYCPNLGHGSADAIAETLQRLGLELGMELPPEPAVFEPVPWVLP